MESIVRVRVHSYSKKLSTIAPTIRKIFSSYSCFLPTDSQWVPLRTPATTLRRQRWVHNGNNAPVRDTSETLSNQKTQNGNFHCQTDPRWKSGIRSRGQIGNRRDKMETSTVRGTKWKLTLKKKGVVYWIYRIY